MAGEEEATLGDGKRGELARLGALEEAKSALLKLSNGLRLSNSHREQSGGEESCEDGLHD